MKHNLSSQYNLMNFYRSLLKISHSEHYDVVTVSTDKKKYIFILQASLKISESEWSDKFSLDTVGSAGTVSCKLKGYNLDVSLIIIIFFLDFGKI